MNEHQPVSDPLAKRCPDVLAEEVAGHHRVDVHLDQSSHGVVTPLGARRSGSGRNPSSTSTRRTLLRLGVRASLRSSPTIRRTPQPAFSRARRRISSRTGAVIFRRRPTRRRSCPTGRAFTSPTACRLYLTTNTFSQPGGPYVSFLGAACSTTVWPTPVVPFVASWGRHSPARSSDQVCHCCWPRWCCSSLKLAMPVCRHHWPVKVASR